MKRIFSILLIFMFCTLSFCVPVFCADNAETGDIVFGDGYSNEADNGKVGAMLATILKISGVNADYDNVKLFNITLGRKVRQYDQETGSHLFGALLNIGESAINGGMTILNFGDNLLNDNGVLSGTLQDFLEWLFGNQALAGDPFESIELETPYTININGSDVVPWVSTKNSISIDTSGSNSNVRENINNFNSRGDFILPMDGAYISYWQDGNAHTNNQYKPSFTVQTGIDSYSTVSTSYDFVFKTYNDRALGHYYDLAYKSVNVWSYYYDTENNASAWAFMPVITNDGNFAMFTYSYIYKGSFAPYNWGGSQYSILPVLNASGVRPYHTNNNPIVFYSETGINIYNSYTNNEVVVYGDTYDNITNNYITNNNFVIKNYTDPSTWPNGGSGSATPDGNGGWNIDWPNFTMPDLNINWSLDGLSEKFPFSIPFDLVAFFRILNAEPETPYIRSSVDLGITTWNIDWNLNEFDNIASLLRNVEFIGFCIFLIIATRNLIR